MSDETGGLWGEISAHAQRRQRLHRVSRPVRPVATSQILVTSAVPVTSRVPVTSKVPVTSSVQARTGDDAATALLRIVNNQIQASGRTSRASVRELTMELLRSLELNGFITPADYEVLQAPVSEFVNTVLTLQVQVTEGFIRQHLPLAFARGVLPHLNTRSN